MTQYSALRLAIDIGGTFTDVALMQGDGPLIASTKTLTTPADPTEGALTGADLVLAEAGVRYGDIGGFVHGTTLATNALIERRGAKVATIATEGFRDILEIAYERRYSQYDIDLRKPDFLVPRARSFTVPERLSASGAVVRPLDEGAVTGLAEALAASGAEAVAICLLHAYANPAHEQRLAALLRAALPELVVSLSSDVSPEAREFDRLCTTVANAYIQPLMDRYLAAFGAAFAGRGLACPVLMMTASGGMTTLETARRYPIRLVESGPAGGAILAARIAAQTGAAEVLSFDMGGTTAKLCLIDGFRPQMARQFEIARAARFIKGSGMPVRIPVVEMIEIGAGGGSIAAVDGLGRLAVGPQSAGSDPGPAAFGRGGVAPTVTDADVALGLIDPGRFAEGRLSIDEAAAREALATGIGAPLGLDAEGAAVGVSEIVDENMAAAARMHAVESGKDLGRRVMIAFGGNGPLHATRLARRAGVSEIIVPVSPGVGSAVGFLHAPVSFEVVRSLYCLMSRIDLAQVNGLLDAMVAEATAVVQAGAPGAALHCRRSAFMRYRGQGHEIEIDLTAGPVTESELPRIASNFETAYARQFSRPVPGMEIEILNWAVTVTTAPSPPDPIPDPPDRRPPQADSRREVLCDATSRSIQAPVFQRAHLLPGDHVFGPALITEPQTTTFVNADFRARVDGAGNLRLSRTAPQEDMP